MFGLAFYFSEFCAEEKEKKEINAAAEKRETQDFSCFHSMDVETNRTLVLLMFFLHAGNY
jgi:hypothetical protein